MAKTQTIRRRIRSVKNINQITKAMEMVAASKLRRVQEAALASRLYSTSARQALAAMRELAFFYQHPFFAERPVKAELVIVFASDRGLAGAYNSNLFKALVKTLRDDESVFRYLITIGQRAGQFVSRLQGNFEVIGAYAGWSARPDMAEVRPVADTAISLFSDTKVDRVRFITTDFSSVAVQNVIISQLLPILPLAIDGQRKPFEEDLLIEPSAEALEHYLLPRFLEVQLYQAALEASASEQAARMMAMKNASDNAEELTEDLTLLFNGARQAAITQELAEITAGAQAVL